MAAMAMVMALLALPAAAHAGTTGPECSIKDQADWCQRSSPVAADFSGWAYLNAGTCATPDCVSTQQYLPGYHWTGKGWAAAWLRHGQYVYTAPWTAGWRWVWIQGSGWSAVPARRVWYPWSNVGAAPPS